VNRKVTPAEYRSLAELRYRIRSFLRDGDTVARAAGLEPQQCFMMLAIRGLPTGEQPTIRTLAERVSLKHQSTVELIDRLEEHGYVRRSRGRDDRREVLITLLPAGERVLEKVVRQRLGELRSTGDHLVQAVFGLLMHARQERNANRRRDSLRRKARGTHA
jgi:DNA-binding MarR family transcriptional regulator